MNKTQKAKVLNVSPMAIFILDCEKHREYEVPTLMLKRYSFFMSTIENGKRNLPF